MVLCRQREGDTVYPGGVLAGLDRLIGDGCGFVLLSRSSRSNSDLKIAAFFLWLLNAKSKASPITGMDPNARSMPVLPNMRKIARLRAPMRYPSWIIIPAGITVMASPTPGTSPRMESHPTGMPNTRNRVSSAFAQRSYLSSRSDISAPRDNIDGVHDAGDVAEQREQDVDPELLGQPHL